MTGVLEVLSSLDGNILLWIQEYLRSDLFTPLWKFITTSGNSGLIWIVLTCFLLVFKKTRKVGAMSAVSLIFSLIFTNLLIKPLVARTRPYELIQGLVLLIEKPYDFSFPSGHSSAAFAAAWVMFRNLPKTRRKKVCWQAACLTGPLWTAKRTPTPYPPRSGYSVT